MHFDQYIKYRALDFKFQGFSSSDHILENPENAAALKMRTVCTQLNPSLFEDLEQVCGLLQVPKRRFLELAVIEALERSHAIIEEVNAFEFHEETEAPTA